jgi:hypothetical protein
MATRSTDNRTTSVLRCICKTNRCRAIDRKDSPNHFYRQLAYQHETETLAKRNARESASDSDSDTNNNIQALKTQ